MNRKALLKNARQWWTTLSIKESKELIAKRRAVAVNGWPLSTWLIEMHAEHVKTRLEHIRKQLRAECISYDELHELQCLAPYIERGDVELLEPAGVPEETL